MKKILIGIDPGVDTGVAVLWTEKQTFIQIATKNIIEAFDIVKYFNESKEYDLGCVYVEDSRKVRWKTKSERAQGAGSVKRDCGIWEIFLSKEFIKSAFPRPNPSLTKWTKERFFSVTNHNGRTSKHARDAAMLIFGRKR